MPGQSGRVQTPVGEWCEQHKVYDCNERGPCKSGPSCRADKQGFCLWSECPASESTDDPCPLSVAGRGQSCFVCEGPGPLREGQGGLLVCVEPCQSVRDCCSDAPHDPAAKCLPGRVLTRCEDPDCPALPGRHVHGEEPS